MIGPTRWLGSSLAVLALTSMVALVANADQPWPPLPPECVPDELLVKFTPWADPHLVSARHGATVLSVIPHIEVHVLSIPAGTIPEKVAEFQADPEVVYAEPNGIVRIPENPPDSTQLCGP